MPKTIDELRATINAKQTEMDKSKFECEEKTDTLYKEKRRLQERISEIEKPYDEKAYSLRKELTNLRTEVSAKEKQAQLESWKGRVPKDNDEIRTWFNLHMKSILGLLHSWHSAHVLRAPKIHSAKGYTVIAISDYNEQPDNKTYVVFSPKGGVFAFMLMHPSAHAGDWTRIETVKIKGKDVKEKLGLGTWDVKKPVQTFMAAVEAAIAKK